MEARPRVSIEPRYGRVNLASGTWWDLGTPTFLPAQRHTRGHTRGHPRLASSTTSRSGHHRGHPPPGTPAYRELDHRWVGRVLGLGDTHLRVSHSRTPTSRARFTGGLTIPEPAGVLGITSTDLVSSSAHHSRGITQGHPRLASSITGGLTGVLERPCEVDRYPQSGGWAHASASSRVM